MECDIFCCGREIPDEKEIEVLKTLRQIGKENWAVRKIDGIFG
jgi:hypothetical protein